MGRDRSARAGEKHTLGTPSRFDPVLSCDSKAWLPSIKKYPRLLPHLHFRTCQFINIRELAGSQAASSENRCRSFGAERLASPLRLFLFNQRDRDLRPQKVGRIIEFIRAHKIRQARCRSARALPKTSLCCKMLQRNWVQVLLLYRNGRAPYRGG